MVLDTRDAPEVQRVSVPNLLDVPAATIRTGPAKIEDPFAPGANDGIGKRARKLRVAARRIRIPSQHRVRQVIRRLASGQLFSKSVCIGQIADDDLDPRLGGPTSGLQLLWTAS